MDFRKKQHIRKLLYSRITIGVLLVLLFLTGRGVWKVFVKGQEARAELARARSEFEALEKRNEFLESEIARLSTKTGIEQELRENFGVAKEGEGVIVIVENEDEEAQQQRTKNGFWSKLFSLFK